MLTEKSSTSNYWNQETGLNQGKVSDTSKINFQTKNYSLKTPKKKKLLKQKNPTSAFEVCELES